MKSCKLMLLTLGLVAFALVLQPVPLDRNEEKGCLLKL
jgi:hypothetical protein